MIKILIKKIFELFGYSISKQSGKKSYLKNVFNTNFRKSVLISYILEPFFYGIKSSHTNYLECYTAAEIFRDFGYNVDVIFYLDKRSIDYSIYDVVYGFGYPLENAFYSKYAETIQKIYYGTGCCPFYSNKMSGLKIFHFQQEKGRIIAQSSRLVYDFWTLQMIMPDLIVSLGNQFVADTYLEINPNLNIRTLSAFYYDCYDIDLSKKDFKEARKHFLWFGSSGLLHKGLDILIDIFSGKNDIFLHICGASISEDKFFDYYRLLIYRSDNIIDHGFVDINSPDYKSIMDLCAFVVFPSQSEGGCPATLNVMANGGLIPIISVSSGLDLKDYGLVFNDINKNTIINKIDEGLQFSEEELFAKSLKIKTDIRKHYSHRNYKQNLTNILLDINNNYELQNEIQKDELQNEIQKDYLKQYAKKTGLLEISNKAQTISVVVPCYKHDKYLKQCLRSVVRQTVLPDTLVIVNDASPDNTNTIIYDFIKKNAFLNTRYIKNETNKGQCYCINRAIEETNTDLYMILNDDDYLLPWAVEYQLQVFKENPSIHLFGTGGYVIKNDSQIKKILKICKKPNTISLLQHSPEKCWEYKNYNDLNMTHSSSTFTRLSWEHVGGYFSVKTKRVVPFSDRDFQLRINACCYAGSDLNMKLSFWRGNSSVDSGINS